MAEPLTFSRSLYTPEAVQAAAAAYQSVATIAVEVEAHEIRVQIEADAAYGDRIFDGFCNHALFETIVQSRKELGGPLS